MVRFCSASNNVTGRRALIFFSALGLTSALAIASNAQAREVWCPGPSESANLSTGKPYETMVGPSTIIKKSGDGAVTSTEVVWSGNIQRCPDVECTLRVDHAESKSFSKTKGFSAGLGATGGAIPVPFPVGGINYSVTNTSTSAFDVANQITGAAGDTWQPVLQVEYRRVDGAYVGRYNHVGSSGGCADAYVLDPNARFGEAHVEVASDPISTWTRV